MGGIHEDLGRINQSVFIAFLQDTGKDLFKKISILKASGIILSKRREMGNLVHYFQTEEPSVCDIDFDFFYCLAHASDAVQILDEWNFNEHDRIHAGAAIVCTVFIENSSRLPGQSGAADDPAEQGHPCRTSESALFSYLHSVSS